MNRDQEYLIRLSAAYLSGERIRLDDGVDYRAVMKEALKHNLFGVAYCAAANSENGKEIIGEDAFSTLQQMFTESIYNSGLTSSVYNALKTALTGAQIRFVPFKGIILKDYYPVPETRSMGDIDILIDEENKKTARAALEGAGFKCVNCNGPVWDYDKNGVRAEIHTSLVNGNTGKNNAVGYFKDAINKASFKGYEGRFNDSFHFEYLIAHLAHHFCFYGAGIRMILDLAVMLKFRDIDIDKILSDLKTAGLDRFSESILTVCYKWYGYGKDFGKNTDKAEDFIAAHGVFGFNNRNISAVVERRELEDGKKNGGVLKTRLRLLFPSYAKLKDIPYIKFIENRPYLTPLAWIYRFFYNLKNRKEFMFDAVKGLSDENSESEAREELEFLKEIGLN